MITSSSKSEQSEDEKSCIDIAKLKVLIHDSLRTSSLTKLTIPKDCLNRKLKLRDQIKDLAIKKKYKYKKTTNYTRT